MNSATGSALMLRIFVAGMPQIGKIRVKLTLWSEPRNPNRTPNDTRKGQP